MKGSADASDVKNYRDFVPPRVEPIGLRQIARRKAGGWYWLAHKDNGPRIGEITMTLAQLDYPIVTAVALKMPRSLEMLDAMRGKTQDTSG